MMILAKENTVMRSNIPMERQNDVEFEAKRCISDDRTKN